jgi:hypothetical protein
MVPPISVAAVQERLICVLLAAVPVRPEGAVNVGAGVAAEAVFEYGLKFTPSVARTR